MVKSPSSPTKMTTDLGSATYRLKRPSIILIVSDRNKLVKVHK